jgi:Ca2+-binding RTX toxin-like protein
LSDASVCKPRYTALGRYIRQGTQFVCSTKEGEEKMKRQALLLLTAMTAAVLVLAAGVALAAAFTCSTNPCTGTGQNDQITGTDDPEEIKALGGNDQVFAKGGNDQVYGGEGDDDRLGGDLNVNPALDGNDKVYGGPGNDMVSGGGRSDLLSGGGGRDNIEAREFSDNAAPIPGMDTVKGGSGNDNIQAADDAVDHIDCGKGRRDFVTRDKGMDTIKNCEVR